MKKNTKPAFNLSELIIAMSLMIVVIGMITPIIKSRIDNDRPKLRYAYSQILKVTSELLANPQIYPDASGFKKTSTYKDPETDIQYTGNYKFTNLFRSNFNILEEVDASKIKNITNIDPYTNANGSGAPLAYYTAGKQDFTVARTTCFRTNNKITYCLPKDSQSYGFANNGYVIIRIYFTDDMADDKAYFVQISYTGQVSIMPTNKIKVNGNSINCAHKATYKRFNQCRMNDMLLYINNAES